MKRTLAEFGELWPAEQKLRDEVHTGHFLIISTELPPEDASHAVRIRVSFIAYLALGGCKKCRLSPRGLWISGAFIDGDDPTPEAETAGLDLTGCNLQGDLLLHHCRFPDPVIARDATLPNLGLSGSHLAQGLRADRLEIKGGIFLQDVTSTGEMTILGATLGGQLICTGGQFSAGNSGNALIAAGLEAKCGVFLRDVTIKGLLCFDRATLGGDFDCTGGKFATGKNKAALMVQGVEAKGGFILRGDGMVAESLVLTNARVSAIVDDLHCWPEAGNLDLDGFRYDAIYSTSLSAKDRLEWLRRQNRAGKPFKPQPYEQLAKVLRDMGHRDDARLVLIEKERLQRADRRQRLQMANLFEDAFAAHCWDWVLRYTVAYGQRPLQAFLCLALFWGLGLWVFGAAFNAQALKPNDAVSLRSPDWVLCATQADQQVMLPGGRDPVDGRAGPGQSQFDCFASKQAALGYPTFNPWIYSADMLLPVVDLEMQGYWIPDERLPIGALARAYLWLHIIAGWGLSLLAVAGFSGLIKSD
ncbi:hypothetical protein [Meridianimarinicoccus sp. MJW13]|uniref:hypothetical protein n=1 Tax=Meridianimarinicoccus sp. MJW13 TaxID=2720031 RepID=UPI00186957DE|nr:hypothetical protein [Fluviibacterium sp. MJW13]